MLTRYFDSTPDCPDWAKLFQNKVHDRVKSLGRPLYVAVPCCGIDGCTEALHVMGIPFRPVNIYDLEPRYKATLKQHYLKAGVPEDLINLNLGAEEGRHACTTALSPAPIYK